MAALDIVIWPDPVLKNRATEVETVDSEVQALLDDMIETMYVADGVGLAAPQVGVGKRIFVVDTAPADEETEAIVFINPEIVDTDGETLFEEACLSVPGEVVEIRRATRVRMRALDRNGEPFEIDAEGLLAIALQHELDHLDGTLIVDRLSSLKREMVKKRMRRLKEEREAEAPAGA